MRPLPPVAPEAMVSATVRLPREYYVRVFSYDYSVDPAVIGRIVQVTADLETMTVICDGAAVASHRRVWARHLTITDAVHVAHAAILRRQFKAVKAHRPVPVQVQTVELASYDQRFGVQIPDQ